MKECERRTRIRTFLRLSIGTLSLGGAILVLFIDIAGDHTHRIGLLPAAMTLFFALFGAAFVAGGQVAYTARRRLLALTVGLLISLALGELAIRILDPWPVLVRGNKLNLPVNHSAVVENTRIPSLERVIRTTHNSLGFRGPEPPNDWHSRVTVLCVGGSTTACTYLSDGQTWPELLEGILAEERDDVWVNNAGFDGHSTFAHIRLLRQYILHMQPRLVLFYCGINDIGRTDLHLNEMESHQLDRRSIVPSSKRLVRSIDTVLGQYSVLYSCLDSLRRQRMARERAFVSPYNVPWTPPENWVHLSLSSAQRRHLVTQHDRSLVTDYRRRLGECIRLCKESGIRVILLTQPALFGEGVDPVTGVDLETVRAGQVILVGGETRLADGWVMWRIQNDYNSATTEIARAEGVPWIDTASAMPRSTEYYYDFMHYTYPGSVEVAEIAAPVVLSYINEWYPPRQPAQAHTLHEAPEGAAAAQPRPNGDG